MFEKPPFTEKEERLILDAIKAAELNTSGEIRLHVEKHCKIDPYERAVEVFDKLGMAKTELRNGVLVYMAIVDHKFAILGDEGINKVVPEGFWVGTKDVMAGKFKEGKIAEGIALGIHDAGEQLQAHFPYQKDDTNELKDDISYGK
ncbi:MAG: TPM domain-containing protein [Salibacteraceae bacterium]